MENKDQLNDLLEDALNDLLSDKIETQTKPQTSTSKEPANIIEKNKSTGVKGVCKDEKSGPSCLEDKDDDGGLGVDEEQMNKFFENMTAQLKAELPKIDSEEAQAKINESVPQIFDLMQNLLSKELLYPALKDLSPKFEEWLKKNSANLSKADKKRYRKQKDIINEIIFVFDNESLDAQERFEKNLDLMEKMQTLGSPPDELTVPEGMGKCSVM